VLAVVAVSGVVLGALYMLRFALGFLFGVTKAPHSPLSDLNTREKTILGLIVVAVFALQDVPFQIGILRVAITLTLRLACNDKLLLARMRSAKSVTSPKAVTLLR
jgi:NADH:ubiquinone oxidoreductase subunit 4 (subunit M)